MALVMNLPNQAGQFLCYPAQYKEYCFWLERKQIQKIKGFLDIFLYPQLKITLG